MLGPTGLGFGPSILFLWYTVELADLAAKYVRCQTTYEFADDNQLHVHCDLSNVRVVVNEDAGTVHHGGQPVDVSQPAETQRRQKRTDVGRHQVHRRQSPV